MQEYSPEKAREFAVNVVKYLRDAGYEAVWAGGCVRDQLIGRTPKDYDVATNAKPSQVRHVFGQKQTLSIGASFGVITVLGPKVAGQIEVATFRQDAEYSDGRHPDSITYSTAPEDARRRDFTINGLFYDPIDSHIIDYVDGVADLEAGIVRAIGDPCQRFHEDKLRMIRAVRFSAGFGFELEAKTKEAIQQCSKDIDVVSAERIASEMRRILTHGSRRRGVELLEESNLLTKILPEVTTILHDAGKTTPQWTQTLNVLDALDTTSFPVALASLLREMTSSAGPLQKKIVADVSYRWRLSNDEQNRTHWLLSHEGLLRRASKLTWPRLQQILIEVHVQELLDFATTVEQLLTGATTETKYCREKLLLPPEELNPQPLITGDDLIAHGIAPGKSFRDLLEAVRDAQLLGAIDNKSDALTLVDNLRAMIRKP